MAGTMAAGDIPTHLKRMGFQAGALVDTGNLYGAVEFYERCLEEGIKPIIGADLTCPATGAHASVMALSRAGYASLCRIISDMNTRSDVALIEAIEQSGEGIAVLSQDVDYALAVADRIGKRSVCVEAVANRLTAPEMRDLLRSAAKHGIRPVASWDVLFLDEADERITRVLTSIGRGTLFSHTRLGVRRASLKDCVNLARMAADNSELLRHTRDLADMVDLSFETGKAHFPHAKPTREESFACLKQMCRDALPRKYRASTERARARLETELGVIHKLGLADYFLVVSDIVAFAAASGIPTAGRGSGAGSLVAYLLEITQVDPIGQGLVFERFLNEHRRDYPDIDIDFSWKRRDEIIAYVYRHFGASRVAMISTHTCFELRSAAREVAKAFGLSAAEAQSVSHRLPWRETNGKAALIERVLGEVRPELGSHPRKAIAELAASIVGFPHHSSVHCGGVVISDRPITYYTPLELAAKGIQVTQFDMHAIERIGLIKIDLLGNRALTVIEEATRDVAESRGQAPRIEPDDGPTAAILRKGKTLSCFQLESPAMRNLLTMLGAANRVDTILALALVRPGPSAGGMKERLAARRSSREHVAEDLLPVYEEDVMRIISSTTGMSLAEADILRRDLKDRGTSERDLRNKFMFLAETAGTSRARALKTWQHLRQFAAYTYCKAHAASHGMLAYAAAYLKANFPLEFYAATLRNHAGMYPVWVHVNESRRVGVSIMLPAVNRSGPDFSIEAGRIRTGLSAIKHVSQTTIDKIIAARRAAPFRSLTDFLARVPATREEVASMVAAGAFDEVEPDRCGALAHYLSLKRRTSVCGQPQLALTGMEACLPTRPFGALQRRKMEYEALGFSPLVHPLEFFACPTAPATDRARRPDGRAGAGPGRSQPRIPTAGLLAAMRHYRANGADLYFLTLDSPQGLRECVVATSHLRDRPEIGRAYAATGEPKTRFGAETVRVHSIESLPEKPA